MTIFYLTRALPSQSDSVKKWLVRSAQQRFWPDPQPLVEKLGVEFFRSAPESPGIYMMRGKAEAVLYVGKAKNLRHRLGSYRRANPERMPRRIVRLLHLVENIIWETCADEAAALSRESELLLALKPRFNRAGVWKKPGKFLAWRCREDGLEMAVHEKAEEGWNEEGDFGSEVYFVMGALVRLLWCCAHPEKGLAGMPAGWFSGRHGGPVLLAGGQEGVIEEFASRLSGLVQGETETFRAGVGAGSNLFEQNCQAEDLLYVSEVFERRARREAKRLEGEKRDVIFVQ
jgi:predicted GIY-YIG superfamily endonuclease